MHCLLLLLPSVLLQPKPRVDCCNPILQVALCCSVPAHWLLLKSRLEKICPRSQGAQALWRWNSRGSEPLQHPFLLQVTSYNREGVLHGV